MKNTFTLLIFLFISLYTFAQAPQGISYQAIAFDGTGVPVSDGNVSVKVSILDNSATGNEVYTETHIKTTNAQGLFNLNIGQGTATSGSFSAIQWGTNSKFLKVEIDPNGGTNYTNVGVNELMSVPYALFAEESGNANEIDNISEELIENMSANFAFDDASDNIIYVFNSITGTWSSQAYNGTNGSPTIVESKGSFAFDDASDNIIYIFNPTTDSWVSQNYNGTNGSPDIVVDDLLSNFAFDDASDNVIYVFSSKTGTWSSQAYNGFNGSPTILISKGNFAFNDVSDDKIYVFSSNTGTWSSQAYNGFNGSPTIIKSNGNFAFDDQSDDIIYIFNSNTGTWVSQAYNGFNGSPNIEVSETN